MSGALVTSARNLTPTHTFVSVSKRPRRSLPHSHPPPRPQLCTLDTRDLSLPLLFNYYVYFCI